MTLLFSVVDAPVLEIVVSAEPCISIFRSGAGGWAGARAAGTGRLQSTWSPIVAQDCANAGDAAASMDASNKRAYRMALSRVLPNLTPLLQPIQ